MRIKHLNEGYFILFLIAQVIPLVARAGQSVVVRATVVLPDMIGFYEIFFVNCPLVAEDQRAIINRVDYRAP